MTFLGKEKEWRILHVKAQLNKYLVSIFLFPQNYSNTIYNSFLLSHQVLNFSLSHALCISSAVPKDFSFQLIISYLNYKVSELICQSRFSLWI